MHLVQTTYDFITAHKLIPAGSTIIVGLSGGPDSVALLHVLHTLAPQLQCTLVAAHLNHGWRESADADQTFCAELTQQLGITLVTKHASDFTPGTQDPHSGILLTGSVEDFGRRMRRAFFAQLLQQYPNARIALAHHQNDQHETFFIRLIRGSGLTGLTGMRPVDGLYIRPLLQATKQEILEYLAQHELQYCVDETNTDLQFLRNRIRHNLMHVLRTCDSRSEASLIKTMHNLSQADEFITQYTEQIFKDSTQQYTDQNGKNHTALNLKDLFQQHPYIKTRLLLKLICTAQVPFTPSTGLFEELLRFLSQPGDGSHTLYNAWKLCKKDGVCWITATSSHQV